MGIVVVRSPKCLRGLLRGLLRRPNSLRSSPPKCLRGLLRRLFGLKG